MGRLPGSKNKSSVEIALEAKIALAKINLKKLEVELEQLRRIRQNGK